MKVSIYEEKLVEDKEREMFLKLVQDTPLDIFLILVDSDGAPLEEGNLLRIHCDLTVTKCCSIGKDLGIPLDQHRQLIVVGEDD